MHAKGSAHGHGCAHAQEKAWEGPKHLPLANLEALHQPEVKGMEKLQTSWLSAAMLEHTQKLSTKTGPNDLMVPSI